MSPTPTAARPVLTVDLLAGVIGESCGREAARRVMALLTGPGRTQRTRAVIAADRLTLDQAERRELAEMLVGHEGSWGSLCEWDARRIADALDAFLHVQALLLQRRL